MKPETEGPSFSWAYALKAALVMGVGYFVLFVIWRWAAGRVPLVAQIANASAKIMRSSPFNPAYESFFMLTGTVAVALWASAFAILALSRYTYANKIPAQRLRLTTEARRSTDKYVNFWLVLQFVMLAGSLLWALLLSLLMLLPNITGFAFGTVAASGGLPILAATIMSLRYGAGALKSVLSVLHAVQARLQRASAWAHKKERRVSGRGDKAPDLLLETRARRVLLDLTEISRAIEYYMAIVRALERGVGSIERLGWAMPFIVSLSLSLLWFPATTYISIAVMLLILLGVGLILQIGFTMFVTVPDVPDVL